MHHWHVHDGTSLTLGMLLACEQKKHLVLGWTCGFDLSSLNGHYVITAEIAWPIWCVIKTSKEVLDNSQACVCAENWGGYNIGARYHKGDSADFTSSFTEIQSLQKLLHSEIVAFRRLIYGEPLAFKCPGVISPNFLYWKDNSSQWTERVILFIGFQGRRVFSLLIINICNLPFKVWK